MKKIFFNCTLLVVGLLLQAAGNASHVTQLAQKIMRTRLAPDSAAQFKLSRDIWTTSGILAAQDVVTSKDHLALTLHDAALYYQRHHHRPISDDRILQFPPYAALIRSLGKSGLLFSPWLHEQGFVQATAHNFSLRKLYPGGVDLGLAFMLIKDFEPRHHHLPNITWALLHHNLTTAAKDCACPVKG